MDTTEMTIRDTLAKHRPADVWLYQGNEREPYRKITCPPRKHKWEAMAQVIVKLQWDRLELRDKGGNVLDVLEVEDEQAGGALTGPVPEGVPNDERLLRLMIAAQESALKNRSAETQQALSAASAILGSATGLFGQLAELVQVQVEATRLQVQRLQQRQAPAAPGVDKSEIDQLREALELAKIVFPALTSGGADKKPAVEAATEGDRS